MIVYARQGDLMVPVLVDDDFAHAGKLSIASHGYVQMTPPGAGKVQLLHRWLLGLQVGDRRIGDHINRDRLDNRQANLRAIDGSLSNANRPQAETAKNVYRMRNRWQAKVKWRGERIALGTFATFEEGRAAVAAFRATHPETLPPQLLDR